ncbi:hypothetical protein [Geminocystis sp. NIES-3709]|uniref:hypothetical protein n=1 Tax=Geminocystis sp. NIES-3709 TaxID=1617448 RepID=UPI0005FC8510|nr:hypothetical protein [Geminocystis sp. NIES-3709]BAQ63944.1 hypothetical protein GM3709_709 [Geminocystis sp. NIES-3709]
MYYYERLLKEGCNLEDSLVKLETAIEFMMIAINNFKKTPDEFSSIYSRMIDLHSGIENEIAENKAQEKFEAQNIRLIS